MKDQQRWLVSGEAIHPGTHHDLTVFDGDEDDPWSLPWIFLLGTAWGGLLTSIFWLLALYLTGVL